MKITHKALKKIIIEQFRLTEKPTDISTEFEPGVHNSWDWDHLGISNEERYDPRAQVGVVRMILEDYMEKNKNVPLNKLGMLIDMLGRAQ